MKKLSPEDAKELQELRTDLINIETMLKSEGWKMFAKEFRSHEEVAYNQMVGSDNAVITHKATGAYHACRNARFWPEVRIKLLQQRIRILLGEE